jgi:riboflavin-specific deaminase-like protein
MRDETGTTPAPHLHARSWSDAAWALMLTAAHGAEHLARANRPAAFALGLHDELRAVAFDDPDALIFWHPGAGWKTILPLADPRAAMADLYLPICSATADRPITVGHLGQSLDGFIATHAGESRWVTGRQNILHLHRLRALCDAVVVGAGTVAADDPQLTTRLVPGPNPLRVVLDPGRRLAADRRVFTDDSSETLYVCARSLTRDDEPYYGRAAVVGLADQPDGGVDVAELLRLLRARGCARVFVEGGGVTVSTFLDANLLDRLHMAIAPLLIGDGRPAIRLPARAALDDCQRPRYRVFRMGGDVLFDCELTRRDDESADDTDADAPIARII